MQHVGESGAAYSIDAKRSGLITRLFLAFSKKVDVFCSVQFTWAVFMNACW